MGPQDDPPAPPSRLPARGELSGSRGMSNYWPLSSFTTWSAERLMGRIETFKFLSQRRGSVNLDLSRVAQAAERTLLIVPRDQRTRLRERLRRPFQLGDLDSLQTWE